MSLITVDPNILTDPRAFADLIVRRLGEHPHDFVERRNTIREESKKGVRFATSGVLMLLRYNESGDCEIVLTKRSPHVVQPGDLCFPGGHVSRRDHRHGALVSWGLSPLVRGRGLSVGRKSSGRRGFRIAADYLVTALREAWEETGLPYRSVRYLGALPAYGLSSFRRVIYPSVGLLTGRWPVAINWEVEKLVYAGLDAFLDEENYHWIDFAVPDDIKEASGHHQWRFPALIIDDDDGREILWGATFHVILSFLYIVLGLTFPDIPKDRLVEKSIPDNYFSGGFKKSLTEGLRREREES
jgi:8-oxo-dGTP pyrophosphatase MutT (NUDIX family)